MAIKFLNTVQVDTDVLYVDATNDRVGIGTDNPGKTLQVGDGSADDVIRTVYSDGGYTDIHGYGIEMSRSASYIRPIADGTQTLYVGAGSDTWNLISYNANVHTFNKDTSEWMRITSAGNVGIGTTSPGANLQIGTVNTLIQPALSFRSIGAPSYGVDMDMEDVSTGYLAYYGVRAGSRTLGLVQSWENGKSGNVGIGTNSPGVKLVTVAKNYSEGPTLGSEAVGGQALLAANGLFGQYSGVSSTTGHVWHQVQRNDSAVPYNMILQPSGGNIGIATVSPAEKLTVSGTDNYVAVQQSNYIWGINTTIGAKLGANSVSGILDMRRWTGSSTDHSVVAITQTNAQVGGYGLDFKVDSKSTNTVATTSRMFISTFGDVGIGTTTPSSKLEVDGGDIEVDDSASGLILRSPDGTRYRITVANGGTLSAAAV